jgi:hypothetical protein
MSENYQIKIHDTLYVGFQRNVTGSMPTALITPYLTTKHGEKQRDNIDYWSKHNNGGRNPLDPLTVENKAMIGFRISRAQRNSGWHIDTDAIRVEDPRGFEVPITLANMIMLTDNNLLENGEIMRECIWGRDGNTNVLLPVNSVPYQQAFTNTERQKTHVNVRTLQLGDHVVLKNGYSGRYLGKLHALVETNAGGRYSHVDGITYGFKSDLEKPIHYIQVKQETDPGMPTKYKYMGFASPNVSRVEKNEPMTTAEVNQLLYDEFCQVMAHAGGKHTAFMLFTEQPKITGQLVDVDFAAIVAQSTVTNQRSRWGLTNKFYGRTRLDATFKHMAMNYNAIRDVTSIPTILPYQQAEFLTDDHLQVKMSSEYKTSTMKVSDISFLQLELSIKLETTGQTFTVRV